MTVDLRKDELIAEIANLLGVEPPPMSTGSTGSKDIYLEVNEVLGLGLPSGLTKPELARGIVESAGNAWLPSFESTGSTVTREGLQAVLLAVRFFLRDWK